MRVLLLAIIVALAPLGLPHRVVLAGVADPNSGFSFVEFRGALSRTRTTAPDAPTNAPGRRIGLVGSWEFQAPWYATAGYALEFKSFSTRVRDFGRERAAGVVAVCMRIVIVRAILFTSATAATLNGRRSAMGAGNGAFAWEYLRRNAEYRAVHEASAHAPSFEPAPFSVRIQGRADPVAARFALPAWKDPDREDGVLSPFWPRHRCPTPSSFRAPGRRSHCLRAPGARIEGLRLAAGGLVLKIGSDRLASVSQEIGDFSGLVVSTPEPDVSAGPR